MLGLYLHIPFCAQRCVYCSFYSTTHGAAMRRRYATALCHEIASRATRASCASEPLSSIYLGGGTPSCLSDDDLRRILHTIHAHCRIAPDAEVTLEANPDDISAARVAAWRTMGINRISMGVQSTDDTTLRLLRRRHTAAEAIAAVHTVCDGGISNISIDLIYGLPGQSMAAWQSDVATALSLPIQHLSAYALSIEPGTPLYNMRARGEVQECDEEMSREMYDHLIAATQAAGMVHYEISNFAYPDHGARHNTAYWQGHPYIGIGAGAHGYDGAALRRINTPDVQAYVAAYEASLAADVPFNPPHNDEYLSPSERYDEQVMTGLRTTEGIHLAALSDDERAYLLRQSARFVASRHLVLTSDEHLRLTHEGIFISDYIMAELMWGA